MNFNKDKELNLDYDFTSFGKQQMGIEIYMFLKDMIINGEVYFGTNLPINKLSKELKVSNTPIREALDKLESDGLVKKRMYQGYRVREFNLKDIKNIYETRIALETYASKLASERGTEDLKNELKKLNKKASEFLTNGDINNYKKSHTALHLNIIKAAKNSVLEKHYRSLSNQTSFLASLLAMHTPRPDQAIQEHNQIINYILNHDGDNASKAMSIHIRRSLKLITKNSNNFIL